MLWHFLVTGWSTRYGCWMPEMLEARSKASAIEKFVALKPTLRRVKAYEIKER
jgi:hypothetical protein